VGAYHYIFLLFDRFLVACVGNVRRRASPEALRRARFRRRTWLNSSSAAVSAVVERPSDESADALMKERGIGTSAHRAPHRTPEPAAESDLLAFMESRHERAFLDIPRARGEVCRSGNFDVAAPCRLPRAAVLEALLVEPRIGDDELAFWPPPSRKVHG